MLDAERNDRVDLLGVRGHNDDVGRLGPVASAQAIDVGIALAPGVLDPPDPVLVDVRLPHHADQRGTGLVREVRLRQLDGLDGDRQPDPVGDGPEALGESGPRPFVDRVALRRVTPAVPDRTRDGLSDQLAHVQHCDIVCNIVTSDHPSSRKATDHER